MVPCCWSLADCLRGIASYHIAPSASALPFFLARWWPGAQEAVILDCKAAKAATREVLQAHSIPLDVSVDLVDLSAFPKAERPASSPSNGGDNESFAGL